MNVCVPERFTNERQRACHNRKVILFETVDQVPMKTAGFHSLLKQLVFPAAAGGVTALCTLLFAVYLWQRKRQLISKLSGEYPIRYASQ